jgi:predicted RNA binding protein YcfA (HicA-like mRNA interferase family)
MNTRKIVPVHHKTLIRLFELEGFAVKRQRGDHIIMTKPGINRPLVIKTSPRKVAAGSGLRYCSYWGVKYGHQIGAKKGVLSGRGTH